MIFRDKQSCYIKRSFGSLIKSETRTLRHWAIKAKVFRSGCAVLLHHLLIVHADFPSYSASHLPVFPCSTRASFILFNCAIFSNCFNLDTKVINYFEKLANIVGYLQYSAVFLTF